MHAYMLQACIDTANRRDRMGGDGGGSTKKIKIKNYIIMAIYSWMGE
jgi:hypothetical protein